MGKNLKSEAVDHLFEAIMTLKDLDEYYAFFEDVCTVNELLSLSQRYEVARMLRQRKTYLDDWQFLKYRSHTVDCPSQIQQYSSSLHQSS